LKSITLRKSAGADPAGRGSRIRSLAQPLAQPRGRSPRRPAANPVSAWRCCRCAGAATTGPAAAPTGGWTTFSWGLIGHFSVIFFRHKIRGYWRFRVTRNGGLYIDKERSPICWRRWEQLQRRPGRRRAAGSRARLPRRGARRLAAGCG
jgi:hypothetical protein